jgi:DNA-binding IclR family transcriptional regulator
VDDGEYAIGVCCLAATVTTGVDAGAVGVVTAARRMGRPITRQTLLLGADRVSRALALGPAAI